MAREPEEREDLLREATALVQRVALEGPALPAGFVAGFRRDGCLSLFYGADPVYQFNSQQQLRRAFVAGTLYKAEQGQLVRLIRATTSQEVHFVRHELTDDEQTTLIEQAAQRIVSVAQAIDDNAVQIIGQVPRESDVVAKLRIALDDHLPLTIAVSPHAR